MTPKPPPESRYEQQRAQLKRQADAEAPSVPPPAHNIKFAATWPERKTELLALRQTFLDVLAALDAAAPINAYAADAAAAAAWLAALRLTEASEWLQEALKELRSPSDAPSRAHHAERL